MSTQNAAEIQADMEQAERAGQMAADEQQARQMAYEQYQASKKKNKGITQIYKKNVAEAKKVANQIVRPAAPPQNLIMTYQVPDPATPSEPPMQMGGGGFSPGAEYNAGIEVNPLADLPFELFSDESPPPAIAVTAAQEGRMVVHQLVMPHDLEIQVGLSSNQGALGASPVIPAEYLQGNRPAVITDEVYEKRGKHGLYPNKFLRREYNDNPYDPYLNKALWVYAAKGYWKYEPNVDLHSSEINRKAEMELNAQFASQPKSKSRKILEQQMKDIRTKNKKRGGAGGVTNDTTRFMFQQTGLAHGWFGAHDVHTNPHLIRRDQMVEHEFKRMGERPIDPSTPEEEGDAQVKRPRITGSLNDYLRILNPTGLTLAPNNSVANDFAEDWHWGPIRYDPKYATEVRTEEEERIRADRYERGLRRQYAHRRAYQEETSRSYTANKEKTKKDILSALGLDF